MAFPLRILQFGNEWKKTEIQKYKSCIDFKSSLLYFMLFVTGRSRFFMVRRHKIIPISLLIGASNS